MKYRVKTPWHGVRAGQVVELAKLHPSIKPHVELIDEELEARQAAGNDAAVAAAQLEATQWKELSERLQSDVTELRKAGDEAEAQLKDLAERLQDAETQLKAYEETARKNAEAEAAARKLSEKMAGGKASK